MKRLAFAFGLLVFGFSPAFSQADDKRTLSFACSDWVVVGRVKNGEFHSADGPDDILGRGWIDATLEVGRVVKGSQTAPTLHVRYFAHTYMRSDQDFMLVLSSQPDGAFLIRTGQLMSAHPKLAARCS